MGLFRRISERNLIHLLIVVMGALLFSGLNGKLHLFDWDEINFAESAREMLISGNYTTVQINFTPFWEKPPLFIWMQAASMHLFGINAFAARFPNTIAGIITLLFLFEAGRKHFGIRMAKIVVIAYAGSFLPFFYFKSGIIDPWFNLFIFGSLYCLILYTREGKQNARTATAGGILLGLAILTKGPAALVISGLSVLGYLIHTRFKTVIKFKDAALFVFATLLTGGSWFLLMLATGNLSVIVDFIRYQIVLFTTEDAGHGGFLLYHFVIVLLGVFPASVFVVASLLNRPAITPIQRHFFVWNAIILFTVLALFTIVKTKIVHYSSMAYFPMAIMAALYIDQIIEQGKRFPAWLVRVSGFMVSLYALALVAASLTDVLKPWLISTKLISDPFTIGNLEADGGWTKFEWLVSLLLIAGWLLFKHYNHQFSPEKAIKSLFAGAIGFMFLAMVWVAPLIERYTQHAVIEFCRQVAEEQGYVNTLGHKSYAIYFYANRQPPGIPAQFDLDEVIEVPQNRPLYFIIKNKRKDQYLGKYPALEMLYEKNGFVFVKYNPIHQTP